MYYIYIFFLFVHDAIFVCVCYSYSLYTLGSERKVDCLEMEIVMQKQLNNGRDSEVK